MTSRISHPLPPPPLLETNWDFQFPRRATRIFFNEFKHRRSHRSISILIRRVYNGATSKGNGEIVSGLATRRDFSFFFFFFSTTIDRRVVEICKLVALGEEKKFIFFGIGEFFFSFSPFKCCSLLIKTCQVIVISQNYLQRCNINENVNFRCGCAWFFNLLCNVMFIIQL